MINRRELFLLMVSAPLFSACDLNDPEGIAWIKSDYPTDYAMGKVFYSHISLFEELLNMFEDDAKISRIAFDFTLLKDDSQRPATDIGFTEFRWNQYRKIFSELGLKEGIFRPVNSLGIEMIAASNGGGSKGYAYSRIPLGPLYSSIDAYPPNAKANRVSYKKLNKENWYLFLD